MTFGTDPLLPQKYQIPQKPCQKVHVPYSDFELQDKNRDSEE